jgi:cytochrome c-type biogenesis protein CcmE
MMLPRWIPRSPRARFGLAALVACCLGLAALGIIAATESVTYYLTPSEAVRETQRDQTLRVGGLVVEGSIVESSDTSSLLLSDGDTEMRVQYEGRLPDVIVEGQGAVVEGAWTLAGDFLGRDIVMRHSNEYRAPADVGN